jgi:hypothetical protein
MFLTIFYAPATSHAENGAEQTTTEEEFPVEVDVERVHARIDPEIELTIPSGRFHLRFDEDFRKLHTRFNLNYEFLDNAIDGSLRFSRPVGRLDSGILFYDGIDFENFFSPALKDGDVVLVPQNEYVQRDRKVELDIRLPLSTPKDKEARQAGLGLFTRGAFTFQETFRGDLDRAEIIDEGLDLILTGNLFYRGVRQRESALGAIPHGTYASTLLEMSYRDKFQEPVALNHRSQFVYYGNLSTELSFTGNASLSYPIKVWREDIATFYTLGGFDTVRGFPKNSIGAYRFLLLSTDFEALLQSTEVDIPEFFTLDFRLTQVRLLFLVDGLLSQDNLNIHSPIWGYGSVGGGISLVFVEGKKRYYNLRIYMAQSLARREMPIFYFSITSSRFKIREQMGL